MSYKAKVCHISTRPHPNADRVQLGVASGYQVVVGLETESGQLGVYFPCDGQLSHEMCMANNLYRKDPKTGESMGGYFEENRRVRAQPFRGQKSEGFWVPLTYLRWTGVDLSTLEAGDEFDALNGKEVCRKYVSEATKRAMERAQKQGQKKKKKEIPMFKKHFDTPKLRYTASAIPKGAVLHITEKLHGTCLSSNSMITMMDGSKKRITQVKEGDYVLGYDIESFTLQPSQVTKTWNHGQNEGDWVKIKFSRKGLSGSHFGSIYTTPEHLVWCPEINEYSEAQNLKPGTKVLVEKFDRGPTYYQEQVMLGKLLGDGYLHRYDYDSASIQYAHRKKDEKYVDYTAKCLGDLSSSTRNERTSGYGTTMIARSTLSSYHIFNRFSDFYPEDSKKIIPPWVAKELGPISMAFLYMDDGSLATHESQEDRANFALCNFSEEDCKVLQEGFRKFGIESVYYEDNNGYSRIRLNADDADRFFVLIAPYVCDHMKYKLPERYRAASTWNVSEVHSMRPITMTQEVLSVHRKRASEAYVGPTKYDLTTETSNFFADGILVHNSGRTGYVQVEDDLPAIKRAINNFFRKEVFKPKREWRKVSGSRRVTYDPDQSVDQGYYSGMGFRFEIHDRLRLKKGETLYYEIVGFTDKKTPIMAPHKVTDKQLKKKYGDEMVYKYGTDRGQAVPYDIYVYRITQTNEDGDSVDLSWPKVMARCNELGLRHVPHYDTLVYDGDEDSLLELVEQYSQGSSKLDSTHIREGVCITVDHHLMGGTHKYKGFWFCELEGIAKNSDEYVDLEDIS
jgi:hypothetical protein